MVSGEGLSDWVEAHWVGVVEHFDDVFQGPFLNEGGGVCPNLAERGRRFFQNEFSEI